MDAPQPEERKLLDFMNATPVVMSCLYDIDMMPEQLDRNSKDWWRMLVIIAHFHAAIEDQRQPTQEITSLHEHERPSDFPS